MTIRDQVYVYCMVIYDNLNEEMLRHLPEKRSEMMRKELRKFERFPKEVRLTMGLKLLGHLVQHGHNPHLEMIHPSWIAERLRRENPQLAFEVLQEFPSEYAQQ